MYVHYVSNNANLKRENALFQHLFTQLQDNLLFLNIVVYFRTEM